MILTKEEIDFNEAFLFTKQGMQAGTIRIIPHPDQAERDYNDVFDGWERDDAARNGDPDNIITQRTIEMNRLLDSWDREYAATKEAFNDELDQIEKEHHEKQAAAAQYSNVLRSIESQLKSGLRS